MANGFANEKMSLSLRNLRMDVCDRFASDCKCDGLVHSVLNLPCKPFFPLSWKESETTTRKLKRIATLEFRDNMFLSRTRKTRESWNCLIQKHPAQRVGTRFRAVSTPASWQVCLSWCPESCTLKHSAIWESFPALFRRFPEFSLGTPEETLETATAFWSFLIERKLRTKNNSTSRTGSGQFV